MLLFDPLHDWCRRRPGTWRRVVSGARFPA